MTRITAFSSPFLLGFDEIERALERVSKSATDGYPPYNIERLPRTAERGEVIRITLAVAGFSEAELEVAVEENELMAVTLRNLGHKNVEFYEMAGLDHGTVEQGAMIVMRGFIKRTLQGNDKK